jgi:L-iditol 2-dehydrogenase
MRAVVYRGVNDLRLETVPVPRIGPANSSSRSPSAASAPPTSKKSNTAPSRRRASSATKPPAPSSKSAARGELRTSRAVFRVGDRVALHHHVPCLELPFLPPPRLCPMRRQYKRTGITAGFEPAGGGYAEYVRVMPFVLPGVVKIPAKNSFAEGAMLEPVNTVLKAVRLNLLRGDAVLVAGQGPIGLMFTRLLQLAGIARPRHRFAGIAPAAGKKIRREDGRVPRRCYRGRSLRCRRLPGAPACSRWRPGPPLRPHEA